MHSRRVVQFIVHADLCRLVRLLLTRALVRPLASLTALRALARLVALSLGLLLLLVVLVNVHLGTGRGEPRRRFPLVATRLHVIVILLATLLALLGILLVTEVNLTRIQLLELVVQVLGNSLLFTTVTAALWRHLLPILKHNLVLANDRPLIVLLLLHLLESFGDFVRSDTAFIYQLLFVRLPLQVLVFERRIVTLALLRQLVLQRKLMSIARRV